MVGWSKQKTALKTGAYIVFCLSVQMSHVTTRVVLPPIVTAVAVSAKRSNDNTCDYYTPGSCAKHTAFMLSALLWPCVCNRRATSARNLFGAELSSVIVLSPDAAVYWASVCVFFVEATPGNLHVNYTISQRVMTKDSAEVPSNYNAEHGRAQPNFMRRQFALSVCVYSVHCARVAHANSLNDCALNRRA